jgi:hypothetical protein
LPIVSRLRDQLRDLSSSEPGPDSSGEIQSSRRGVKPNPNTHALLNEELINSSEEESGWCYSYYLSSVIVNTLMMLCCDSS